VVAGNLLDVSKNTQNKTAMMQQPPRLAKALLVRFCHIDFHEEIEGDLNEQFITRVEKKGLFSARLFYWRDVIHAISRRTPGRHAKTVRTLSLRDMMRHFFKVSFRHLYRSRLTTAINISGLAISLACFIFIGLYIMDELTYDSFHTQSANVYRLSHAYRSFGNGDEETDTRVPGLWVQALKEQVPEIKQYTRFSRFGYTGTVRYEKRNLLNAEQQFFWVDPTYPSIFSLSMLAGADPSVILKTPGQVIINKKIARKYFGTEDPIGQTLIYARDGFDIPLMVAGVMMNYPSNVHFHPDFLASNVALAPLWNRSGAINSSYSYGDDRVNSWRDAFTYSYVELEPGTDPAKLDAGLRRVMNDHLGDDAKDMRPVIVRQPDIHFRAGMLIALENPGDPVYLFIFGSIGLLILLIASINYMNLATARSVQRSREVGLRKTLGVSRTSLIFQFIGESIILTAIAVVFAVILVIVLLPGFSELAGHSFFPGQFLNGKVAGLLIILILVVGLISGSYPAFYLSAFKPVQVLKGQLRADGRAGRFRQGLVVFQFSVTLVLIVGTLVIRQQLSYINETKLSQYKHQIIGVGFFGFVTPEQMKVFGNEIKRRAEVEATCAGSEIPRQERFGWIDMRLKVPEIDASLRTWKRLEMDPEFPSLFGLKFVAGRDFSTSNPADTGKVILNEAAVRNLQITPDKAPGLILENEATHEKREVIGVVRDFNYMTVRLKVEPLVITAQPNNADILYVKLAGKNYEQTILAMEKIWKQMFPSAPFSSWFLDEEFDQLYKQEKQTGKLFQYFSGLAIFIGCLGLFGLAAFTVEQRTKEIGIRKVLGASTFRVTFILTYRFIKLILVSLMIGFPLAYYIMYSWLNRFAYHTSVGWSVFVGSGLLVLILTCLTVGIESLRAAMKNPAEAIKYE
jgi:putative ABC transport system permease protein